MINDTADAYGVPRSLVHRVIQRESDYRPRARNGPYYGLMQIHPATARQMGVSRRGLGPLGRTDQPDLRCQIPAWGVVGGGRKRTRSGDMVRAWVLLRGAEPLHAGGDRASGY